MIIAKHKRDINLLVLQFGAAIAVSFAGFLYSRFRKHRRTKPTLPSLPVRSPDDRCGGCLDQHIIGEDAEMEKSNDRSIVDLCPNSQCLVDDKNMFLLPEFEDVIKEFDSSVCNDNETPRSDASAPLAFPSEEDKNEISQLRNTIRALHERERSLEAKLLEYYSLKEQQKVAMELRNRLKLNQMETRVFNLKIKSLQAENQKLRTQCSDHAKVVSELEAAESRIRTLRKKLQVETQRNRDQILSLRDRVAKLQEQELEACLPDPDANKMVQRLRDLEAEIDELKDLNTRLQIENSELAEKLESAQLLANSKLEDPEIELLREESIRLRNENEELKRGIEQIQSDRCTDLEELVYLRWINACLRYELRNYQPPTGKTVARDLSTTLSPKSEEKAKRLILEYAAETEGLDENTIHTVDLDLDDDQWSSSLESLITDSEFLDDSSVDTLLARKASKPGKKNLLRKLRRLLHGKEIHDEKTRSPEGCRDRLSSSSKPRLRSRHSMDFQMLMRNRAAEEEEEESKEEVGVARRKSENAYSVLRTLREGGTGNGSDHCKKTELIKFAEALRKNSGPMDKKLHKKSVSYFF
ncbi:PREDICTED: protein CHUP1, chloroplastic [Tarenaya hassleriana]|uniref:protein CHUP1, chloroplastic n=1 Tax=Tarenaya hassleriana TaxID=28532 RepID=UPI00053CA33D|nr:PREDICTED: protein CHUP1, chloroplastic [Tarenaya hassleriana]XP_010545661.1 PREDICTED: protein CHUP1, chloroplastic [Tarenaya hassleriana]